jgi:hypothetical protein
MPRLKGRQPAGACEPDDRDGSIPEHSGRDPGIDGFHEVQNHVSDGLIADRGIDHGVVDGAVWPFDFEIFLDEIGTLAVDGIHELLGFRLALASRQEAPDFVFSRSVKKHTQGV